MGDAPTFWHIHCVEALERARVGDRSPGRPPTLPQSLCRNGCPAYIGGISTVSIMYTVAFVVCTPPQTTEALLTCMPLPVTVSGAP